MRQSPAEQGEWSRLDVTNATQSVYFVRRRTRPVHRRMSARSISNQGLSALFISPLRLRMHPVHMAG
jgi:hypothetical protein